MSLVEHAKRELELSGQWKEDPAYAQSIVAAVAAFASYWHSGGSASVAIEQLNALIRFEPLSPLNSDPAEWIDRTEMSGTPMWQSTRDPKAFSTDGGQTWYRLGEEGKSDNDLGSGVTVVHLREGEILVAGSEILARQSPKDCCALLDVYGDGALVVMSTPDRHEVLRPNETADEAE